MFEKWRRFRKRTREDQALILRAAVLLPLSNAGLRLFGFQRWKALVEKLSLSLPADRILPDELQYSLARRAALAMQSVELHGPTRPNCLERSMALWWLLRREGVACKLQIGGRKRGERFEAHAWVEFNGQVLNDSQEVHVHYARFDAPIVAPDPDSRAAGKAASR